MSGIVVALGDPGWLAAHQELRRLHIRKSATYGNQDDALHNFQAVAEATSQPPERYVIERTIEKLTRALNMIDAGTADAVKEYPDCASLMLCAEALRRRRATS